MRNRIAFLIAVLALPVTLNAAESQKPGRPNVDLFLVDDMGWIDCGAKGKGARNSVTIQLAEVAVTRNLFADILDHIARLAIPPPLVT